MRTFHFTPTEEEYQDARESVRDAVMQEIIYVVRRRVREWVEETLDENRAAAVPAVQRTALEILGAIEGHALREVASAWTDALTDIEGDD